MPSTLRVEAVVCTKDRPHELRDCLRSLGRQTEPPTHVMVVNGGGPDPDPAILGEVPLEVVRHMANLPAQRNVALARIDADVVAFFDDDVVLEPSYLEAAVNWLSGHPRCAGVTGNIVNDPPRRVLPRVYRAFFALANDNGRVLASGDAMYLHHPTVETRVDLLSGSNMVLRRAAAAELRFDDVLTGYAYMEDVDFSLRLSRKGELWAVPNARLVHARSHRARVPQRRYVEQGFANAAYLFGKHRRVFGFRWSAYARRMAGRTIQYLALSIAHRSIDPTIGTLMGLSRLPGMIRKGAAHVD